ncbi:MAG TPA: polysaccharide biosynthesis C-terminal domain-containing protein [Bacteroidota bacterium]|nr:polysaccharide biosynthesis C-terminal domain-containing protein [Bacteroidota bacterium]
MFDKIKRLGTDTAIYGISTILGRFLNFLLVPFYTNVLHTQEYGVVANVYSIIAFVTVLYNYGMESSYFKYSSTLEIGDTKDNFSTPFLALVLSSVAFSSLMCVFSAPVGHLLQLPQQFTSAVYYSAGILFFDTLGIVPFAALRMEHKPKLFAAIKFTNIAVNVAMNIILLLVLHKGIEGIFISGLTASVVTYILLLPTVLRHLKPKINASLLRALLKFGLPFVPAGLATMAIQVIDRPILLSLTNYGTVGIYQANYRLGIFMMLIVSMYDYAWRPFYFSTAREPDAKKIFARVLTYLLLFMSMVFLFLTLFIGNIVHIKFFGHYLIHPDYWSGLPIVPVVLMGYVFLGISNNMSAGIYIEKKTYFMPPITFVGAAVNIGANYLMIPSMGMMGAAWATFLAYFIMAVMLYLIVRRVYPVEYEFGRMGKLAAAVGLILLLFYYVRLPIPHILYKIGLLALFCVAMYAMNFFNAQELRKMRSMMRLEKAVKPPEVKSDDTPPETLGS